MKNFVIPYRLILICLLSFQSINLNAQWTSQYSVNNAFESIHFSDANNGWVVGQNGLILHTTDGGQLWTTQNSGVSVSLNSVLFIDANNGWACGGEWGVSQTGIILNTTNGGQSWNVQSNTQNALEKIFFSDQNHGWVVGSFGFMMVSVNGGQTWTNLSSGTNESLMDICFYDLNTGWTSGGSFDGSIYKGLVLKSTNGGTSWAISYQSSTAWIECIHFVDENYGWAAGANGNILNTNDGGITWNSQNSGINDNLVDMHFIDAKKGWMVGESNKIIYTFDGGITWANQQLSNSDDMFFGVHFNDPLYGWAVGTNWGGSGPLGKIIYTDNNGGDVSGIGDLENGTGILVFPNPTEGEFFVDLLKTSFDQTRIDLLNITGKVQMTRLVPPDSKRISININDLPKGIYFIKVIDKNNSWVKKVIYK